MPNRPDTIGQLRRHGNKAADRVAGRAASDPTVRRDLVAAVRSPEKRVKNAAAKSLNLLGRMRPETLYRRLPLFLELMGGEDSILKWNAIDVVGNLSAVDRQGRFDGKLVGALAALVSDDSLITATHAVDALVTVAEHQPRFGRRVLDALLRVDVVSRDPQCTAILAGRVLERVPRLRLTAGARKRVIAFARKHLDSPRAATRRKAAILLKRLG